ncbi:MAG: hypothetical protein MJZ16_00090 [Bacteroidales bacterium]|nr:hypothetical protein [Bacteroidales bacterium]
MILKNAFGSYESPNCEILSYSVENSVCVVASPDAGQIKDIDFDDEDDWGTI